MRRFKHEVCRRLGELEDGFRWLKRVMPSDACIDAAKDELSQRIDKLDDLRPHIEALARHAFDHGAKWTFKSAYWIPGAQGKDIHKFVVLSVLGIEIQVLSSELTPDQHKAIEAVGYKLGVKSDDA